MQLSYIGCLGLPKLHPVFDEFAKNVETFSKTTSYRKRFRELRAKSRSWTCFDGGLNSIISVFIYTWRGAESDDHICWRRRPRRRWTLDEGQGTAMVQRKKPVT